MGFHPDAGASFYLSHLPGYLGEVHLFQLWGCNCLQNCWSALIYVSFHFLLCTSITAEVGKCFHFAYSSLGFVSFRRVLGSNWRKAQWCRNDCLWSCHPLYVKWGSLYCTLFYFTLCFFSLLLFICSV